MARILATDGLAEPAAAALREAGHEVEVRDLDPEALLAAIGDYDALVVRSATQVTEEVLRAGAPRLQIVGRAGVGVDNIDCDAATRLGVIVTNAPLGNILSAAEHTIGMIFAAARNIAPAHRKLVEGSWDKKGHVGVELHGRTLGAVGLGKIGRHVAKVMQAAGMHVIAYDPFLSREIADELQIEPVELDDLLARADFVTFHVPLTDKTRGMIDADALAKMKTNVRLINVARGGIVDEAALAAALTQGRVAGAAFDVFAAEPLPEDSPLRDAPRITLTPHLGASTEEAQVRVATDIANAFNAYFADGTITNAVNVRLHVDPAIDDYLDAAAILGRALAQALSAPLRGLEVRARGELAHYEIKPLAVAALKGALEQICDDQVNLVNASLIAEERGITLTTSRTENLEEWSARLAIKATTVEGEHVIGGSLIDGELRIQRFDDYTTDLPVGGHLLVLEYGDRPGMVGRIGTILGEHDINIARMEVSRVDGRGEALVVITLDDPVPEGVLAQIRDAIRSERAFTMSL